MVFRSSIVFSLRGIMENTEDIVKKSFKERVIEAVISCATIYEEKFVKYDYLVCSEAFGQKRYQEIRAEKNNYLHLIGVNTSLSANAFYQKCIDGTLGVNDFDFVKKDQSEQSVKGSVRQKIKALPKMLQMFDKQLLAEKDFKKNNISCLFSTANAEFTIGFVKTGRPKSLMRKNQLDKKKCKPVDLVMKKKRDEDIYSERIFGSDKDFNKYKDDIKGLIHIES